MKNYKSLILLTAFLVTGVFSGRSAEVVMVDWSVVEKTEITIRLGISPFDPAPNPPQPQSAKIITPGTSLTLSLASGFGTVTNVNWFKDGELIASDRPELVYGGVGTYNSGTYHATFYSSIERLGSNETLITTLPTKIVVRDADRHRIANQSSRVKISPESPTAIFGFVIESKEGSGSETQEMLIRAIGPTLAEYGVTNPIPDPFIELRSAGESEVIKINFQEQNGQWFSDYYERLSTISGAVGAFPVDQPNSLSESTGDQARLFKLEPGPYTVSVRSNSNRSGEVLIEIYEVPREVSSSIL